MGSVPSRHFPKVLDVDVATIGPSQPGGQLHPPPKSKQAKKNWRKRYEKKQRKKQETQEQRAEEAARRLEGVKQALKNWRKRYKQQQCKKQEKKEQRAEGAARRLEGVKRRVAPKRGGVPQLPVPRPSHVLRQQEKVGWKEELEFLENSKL